MNNLDIIILTILVITLVFGLVRGLIREVFSLLALILGLFVAAKYYSLLAGYLGHWISGKLLACSLGFVLTFTAVSILVGLFGSLLRRFIIHANLDVQDRLLGGIFGLIKGLIISTVVVLVLIAFMSPSEPFLSQSRLLPYLVRSGELVIRAIPDELTDKVQEKKKHLFELWQEQQQEPKETEGRTTLWRGCDKRFNT